MSTDSNVNVLIGLTLTEFYKEGGDRIILKTADRSFLFYHAQDCCESVTIDRIKGSFKKLIGEPLIEVIETISHEDPPFYRASGYTCESQTWSIYTLKTADCVVEIRWHGTSNGYYSESVSFVETTKGEPSW